MHQALSLAKAQGKAPGAVEETIRGAHTSTLDWRTLLRRYMTDAARSDYSWSLPNRRFIDSGLYLPSIRSEGIDTVAIIIDTSGSVDAQALAAFWTEVRDIAAEIRPETVIVLQVDAALQDAAEYAPGDLPEEIALKGRGGTDFRPGFAWLEEQGTRPSLCLYFTDMDCDRYPDTEPHFPVVFCEWGEGDDFWRQPPPLGRAPQDQGLTPAQGRCGAPPPSAIEAFAMKQADRMKITRDFRPMSDRYSFDFGPCTTANGFAQIDTRQDASYYGTWGSPSSRTIINFCEGDVTTTVCDTDAEFAAQLRELASWNAEAGYGPMKIDAGFNDGLRQAFEQLGVADLLH